MGWKRRRSTAATARPKGCTIPAAASTKPTQKRRDQERSPRSRRKWNATLSAAKAMTRATTWKRTRWTNPSPQRPPHQKKKDEPKSTINEEEQKPEHAGKHMSGEYECSDEEPDVTDDFGDDKEESTRQKLANLLGVTLDEKPKETTIKDQMEAIKWEDLHYTHQSRAIEFHMARRTDPGLTAEQVAALHRDVLPATLEAHYQAFRR